MPTTFLHASHMKAFSRTPSAFSAHVIETRVTGMGLCVTHTIETIASDYVQPMSLTGY